MSLRQVKFDDCWRGLFKRDFLTQFTGVAFERLACLADGEVKFSGGISAIVGSNGVGKSTLIAAIAELLDHGELRLEPAQNERVRGSALRGSALFETNGLNLAVSEDGNGTRTSNGDVFTGECRSLDPSGLATRCVDQIHRDQNFDELLESVTGLDLDSSDLEIASYLVGKDYTAISIAEIADYAGFDRFPYFRVRSGGVNYGSEAMGRGELALLLTYWTLRDISKNSILILEEPETHVSPRSQECLMNILAKFALERGIWIIIATHSPTVISRVPNDHAKLVIRYNGPAKVISNPSLVDIRQLLGGGVAFQGVLLVEDHAAKDVLMALLEGAEPDLVRELEVLVAGSDSKITTLLETMPITREWFTLVGVYDGDRRGEMKGREFKWPHMFLPGSTAPELPLIEMAKNVGGVAETLAVELHKTKERVEVALSAVAGSDHHDFFRGLSPILGIDVGGVRRGFTRVWARREENESLVAASIKELKTALNKPRTVSG
jgi:energy-coupling factor transporter ATP-binding protein EcfA2